MIVAWNFRRESRNPLYHSDDRETMAQFSDRLEASRYDTYLEQLGVDYTQLEGRVEPCPSAW